MQVDYTIISIIIGDWNVTKLHLTQKNIPQTEWLAECFLKLDELMSLGKVDM